MRFRQLIAGVAATAITLSASAVSYVYVDASRGSDGEEADGSWEKPAKTIRKGLKLASTAAEKEVIVSVQPGTYPGAVYFNSGVNSKIYDYEDRQLKDRSGGHNISVRGQTGNVDNADPRLVVIDAGGTTNCVTMTGASASLCNVTCTNGVWGHHTEAQPNQWHTAGGIAIYAGAMASNCVVTCCTNNDSSGTAYYGGGVFLNGNGSLITDSRVENCALVNTATSWTKAYGGGIAIGDNYASSVCRVVVSNCCCIAQTSGMTQDRMFGGGVYGGIANSVGTAGGKIIDSEIVDCYLTNTAAKAITGQGGGIWASRMPAMASNCVVRSCRAEYGLGVSCNGGGRLYNTTVTNCTGNGPVVWSDNYAANATDLYRPIYSGVRVVGCTAKIGLEAGAAYADNCLIENNVFSGSALKLACWYTATASFTGRVQRTVVRNNTTSGHVVTLGRGMFLRLESSWIVDNTAPDTMGVVSGETDYLASALLRECLITGNKAGYGLIACPYGPGSPWPYTDSTANFIGLTIVSNVFSKSVVSVVTYAKKDYCALTNCFIGANGTSEAFSSNMKSMALGLVSHCFIDATSNLPDDPDNMAKNIVGRDARMQPGIWVPSSACRTRDAGIELPYMRDADYWSMGVGTFNVVKSADWGVRIQPNLTRASRAHVRIAGHAPDIGACESWESGLILFLR